MAVLLNRDAPTHEHVAHEHERSVRDILWQYVSISFAFPFAKAAATIEPSKPILPGSPTSLQNLIERHSLERDRSVLGELLHEIDMPILRVPLAVLRLYQPCGMPCLKLAATVQGGRSRARCRSPAQGLHAWRMCGRRQSMPPRPGRMSSCLPRPSSAAPAHREQHEPDRDGPVRVERRERRVVCFSSALLRGLLRVPQLEIRNGLDVED